MISLIHSTWSQERLNDGAPHQMQTEREPELQSIHTAFYRTQNFTQCPFLCLNFLLELDLVSQSSGEFCRHTRLSMKCRYVCAVII